VEERIVSVEERRLPTYSGFHFQFRTVELLDDFELVRAAAT
jgi:hypothetical protein